MTVLIPVADGRYPNWRLHNLICQGFLEMQRNGNIQKL